MQSYRLRRNEYKCVRNYFDLGQRLISWIRSHDLPTQEVGAQLIRSSCLIGHYDLFYFSLKHLLFERVRLEICLCHLKICLINIGMQIWCCFRLAKIRLAFYVLATSKVNKDRY